MKILLANPPAYIKDIPKHFIQAGSRWSFAVECDRAATDRTTHYHPYPFFLGYSSALLKKEFPEFDVRAYDACALDLDEKEFISFVKRYAPDLLVVEIPTISFSLMMDVLKEIKETTGCAIAVAGPHISALCKEVMEENKFIDYGLVGEYELTLKDLVTAISRDGKLESIKGLAFRDNGKIVLREVSPRWISMLSRSPIEMTCLWRTTGIWYWSGSRVFL